MLLSRPRTSSLQRTASCPPEISRTLHPDPDFRSFGLASEETEPGRGGLLPDCSSSERGGSGAGGLRGPPRSQASQQTGSSINHEHPEKHPYTERGQREKSAERTHRKKPVSKVVANVQDLPAQVRRAVKTHPEDEGRTAVCPAAQAESIPGADPLTLPAAKGGAHGSKQRDKEQQGDGSLQSLARECPPASTEGAVNKVLLKVIESEKLVEATEGKRLGFPVRRTATHTLPDTRSKKRAGRSVSGHKTLFLDLPRSAGPDSAQGGGDEKRPWPPALGMVFNNSSSQSGTHGRVSPASSPLPPRLPSPQQQHRRILRLPGEREAALDDSPGRKSGTFSGPTSVDTLEPSSSAKVTETKGASSAFLRADQPRLVPGEPLEKSLGSGKITAQAQHQSPPG